MGGKGSKAQGDKKQKKNSEPMASISFEEKKDDTTQPKTDPKSTTKQPDDKKDSAQEDEAVVVTETEEDKEAKQAAIASKVSKSIASRLSVGGVEKIDTSAKPKATKLFEAPKGPERSKIFQALNPEKLYFESRREKAEQEEEKVAVRLLCLVVFFDRFRVAVNVCGFLLAKICKPADARFTLPS
eukprot:m.143560 g.143560  ORF g.143560 m.143560 type:complete len:185 (+) comp16020_c1_seq4:134-688(+)